jgi:biopolymer transport protein TolQ
MLELIWEAGWIAKLVLLVLFVASVASWAVIVFKWLEYRRAEADTAEFLEAYIERSADGAFDVAKRCEGSPLAVIFAAGHRELAQLMKLQGPGTDVSLEQIELVLRRLRWLKTSEAHRLERGLAFLATTGSSAPFVGLFGTVVGIMSAFRDIGAAGSASLAVVAPGIAEALVATAAGLAAAIPAVIAYNYASVRMAQMLERIDDFQLELTESMRQAASRVE